MKHFYFPDVLKYNQESIKTEIKVLQHAMEDLSRRFVEIEKNNTDTEIELEIPMTSIEQYNDYQAKCASDLSFRKSLVRINFISLYFNNMI